jgi:hypothetical protein
VTSDVEERVEVILDVDLDAEVMCNAPRCERVAHWGHHCTGCGAPWIACNPHREITDGRNHGLLTCRVCGAWVPAPIPWLPL